MENRKNLCAMIPTELHARVREEQESMEVTLGEYVEMVLTQHFERGGKTMSSEMKTLAFQVSTELFGRVKAYLAAHPGVSQKTFVIGLIEAALDEYDRSVGAAPGQPDDGQGQSDAGPDETSSED